jgi:hypothetical protein
VDETLVTPGTLYFCGRLSKTMVNPTRRDGREPGPSG